MTDNDGGLSRQPKISKVMQGRLTESAVLAEDAYRFAKFGNDALRAEAKTLLSENGYPIPQIQPRQRRLTLPFFYSSFKNFL